MKLMLRIDVDGMHWNGGVIREIPEMFERCFAPLKTCDEPIIAYATGDVMEREAKIIMKTREDAAEVLAKEISEMLVMEMKKNDTHNGYEK